MISTPFLVLCGDVYLVEGACERWAISRPKGCEEGFGPTALLPPLFVVKGTMKEMAPCTECNSLAKVSNSANSDDRVTGQRLTISGYF